MINIFLLAFTNGYFVALAMTYGTDGFEDRQSAGQMMAFYLNLGIFSGCVLAEVIMAQLF